MYKYISVATVKTPVDALSTLRAYPGFDLVVTDLHMPEMNGIELQKQINREFKLPVISKYYTIFFHLQINNKINQCITFFV